MIYSSLSAVFLAEMMKIIYFKLNIIFANIVLSVFYYSAKNDSAILIMIRNQKINL